MSDDLAQMRRKRRERESMRGIEDLDVPYMSESNFKAARAMLIENFRWKDFCDVWARIVLSELQSDTGG